MNALDALVDLMTTGEPLALATMVEVLRPAAGSMTIAEVTKAVKTQLRASVDAFPLTATNEEIARHAAAALLARFPV